VRGVCQRKNPDMIWDEGLSIITEDMRIDNMEKSPEVENVFMEVENLQGVNIVRAEKIVKKAFSKRVRQLPDDWRGHLKGLMQKLFY